LFFQAEDCIRDRNVTGVQTCALPIMMAQGYGYGGEGDWKVAAMTAILKAMGEGGNGCSLFMEDYTYNLVPGAEYSLGAHMLEVCPCCAAEKPRIETHPLGIGMNEKDPARLVFEGKPGKAIVDRKSV